MANQKHLDIFKQGVEIWNEWREKNSLTHPDLSRVGLGGDVDYSNINLSGADLRFSSLTYVNLSGANLSGTNLMGTYLMGANLHGARLNSANINVTNLNGADLTNADFSGAFLHQAIFANVDLQHVIGLDSVTHLSPTAIDIRTLYRSQGNIPETFLQGAGVPDSFITFARSLKLNDYYTCFISYSSKDQEFAECLYVDLQSKGVRCWFAPEYMDIGDKIRPRIEESIRLHDKLLLVLSENSIASNWVAYEVERALNKEPIGVPNVLYPIRLDDTVMTSQTGWAYDIKSTRHIGDFSNWKNYDDYQKAFSRLLRALKSESQSSNM